MIELGIGGYMFIANSNTQQNAHRQHMDTKGDALIDNSGLGGAP